MKGLVLAAVAAAMLNALSCADDASPDPAVAEPAIVELELDPFVAEPGTQGLVCQTFANPFGAPIEVAAWKSHLDTGGHHMLVFPEEGAVDTPLAPCAGLDQARGPIFQGQSIGTSAMRYPNGVTAMLEPGTGLTVQIHYLNATSGPLTIANAIELELGRTESGVATKHVSPVFLQNLAIRVPARSTATVSRTCTFSRDISLVWLTSHMHVHGTRFEVRAGDRLLYETARWDDPPSSVFDPLTDVPAGEAVTFSCSYANDTDSEITFGGSLEDDEMCVTVGGHVSDGEPYTLSCEEDTDPTRCLACSEALIAGQPERVCTDDGPPSSGDKLAAFRACTCDAAGACAGACGDNACAMMPPSAECMACIDASCVAERDACFGGT